MAGKYTLLKNYLCDLPRSQSKVSLTFKQIEQILCDKLPPSAYQYQAWWNYEKRPRSPEK